MSSAISLGSKDSSSTSDTVERYWKEKEEKAETCPGCKAPIDKSNDFVDHTDCVEKKSKPSVGDLTSALERLDVSNHDDDELSIQDTDSTSQEWEVQEILDKRGKTRATEYLIWWKFCEKDDATWEPAAHVPLQLRSAFNMKRNIKKTVPKPKQAPEPVMAESVLSSVKDDKDAEEEVLKSPVKVKGSAIKRHQQLLDRRQKAEDLLTKAERRAVQSFSRTWWRLDAKARKSSYQEAEETDNHLLLSKALVAELEFIRDLRD